MAGHPRPVPSRRENQIMTAEAPSGAATANQGRPPAAVAYLPASTNAAIMPATPSQAPTRTGDEPVITELAARAAKGDKQAWDALVERYIPLVWSICRSHRLGDADAENVSQNVWLHLAERLDRIRDPAALPGWLATTTRRECLHVLAAARGPLAAEPAIDAETTPEEQARTVEQELLTAERHARLREALQVLPPSDRQVIFLLAENPRLPYAEISARLGIPVGSIGPIRRRCLDKLRRHPAIAALVNADITAADEMRGQAETQQ
jgi:RNA polymerase sigma factor (sigma-70 family)